MRINYWDCPYAESEHHADGWQYGCSHPDGFICELDNKEGGAKADCPLLNKCRPQDEAPAGNVDSSMPEPARYFRLLVTVEHLKVGTVLQYAGPGRVPGTIVLLQPENGTLSIDWAKVKEVSRETEPAMTELAKRLVAIKPIEPFQLGQTVATPGALSRLDEKGVLPNTLLQRHRNCDWGEICDGNKATNEQALKDGGRLKSVYTYQKTCFWVITDAADGNGIRHSTCILLPEEY